MFAVSNLLMAIASLVSIVAEIYIWVIIGRAIISFVNADPYNQIVRFVHAVTEPPLKKLRDLFPFLVAGGIDFSPVVLIIAIQFLRGFLVPTLQQMAMTM
ncbi:MAG: YggT family protein [Desulfotalea sp.]